MMRAAINGINGKMGTILTEALINEEDAILVCGFDIAKKPGSQCDIYTSYDECEDDIDVIIDFSHPSQIKGLTDYAVKRKIPLVISTTGLSEEEKGYMIKASETIPVFNSANMTLGVNLIIELVKKAANILYPDFDIEIIEKHHNQKIDAPSGTALMIADELNETLENKMAYTYDRHSQRKKREKTEIGLHAVRGGTIVGEHEVIFAGKDEVISIKHEAHSKEVFATGSIKAAFFIKDQKPGLYSMKDMLK